MKEYFSYLCIRQAAPQQNTIVKLNTKNHETKKILSRTFLALVLTTVCININAQGKIAP